jgi:hypothetical protein
LGLERTDSYKQPVTVLAITVELFTGLAGYLRFYKLSMLPMTGEFIGTNSVLSVLLLVDD